MEAGQQGYRVLGGCHVTESAGKTSSGVMRVFAQQFDVCTEVTVTEYCGTFSTLRTGDADLRFYIITVQDG